MSPLKILSFFILVPFLISCQNKPVKLETETYKYEIKKASIFSFNSANIINISPLDIDAEKISLKDILEILIETEGNNIILENVKNNYYSLQLKQKATGNAVNEVVLKSILNQLNLEIDTVVRRAKFYVAEIQDSIKYSKNIIRSKNSSCEVLNISDEIIIKNCKLEQLAEVMNSKYSKNIICNEETERIDYQWNEMTFEELKQKLKQDLGVVFSEKEGDNIVYIVRNNKVS